MHKSDVEETLVHLYLRLNGYFTSSYIVHAPVGVTTELDVLAVRFPQHQEPEREIPCDKHLAIPADHIDFVVGEVKSSGGNLNFNRRFRDNPDAIRSVLQRFGAFPKDEIDLVVKAVPQLLDPAQLQIAVSFPETDLRLWADASACRAKLRFIPFAIGQTRAMAGNKPYIFQDDIINFIWECFRPSLRRPASDVRYNFELWGFQFTPMVRCFKERERTSPPTLAELYYAYGVSEH